MACTGAAALLPACYVASAALGSATSAVAGGFMNVVGNAFASAADKAVAYLVSGWTQVPSPTVSGGAALEEAFSHSARAEGEDQMFVEVVLQDGPDEISITRTWWFKEDGHQNGEAIEVRKNGYPLQVAVEEDQRPEVLEEYVESLIPHRVAKFFFFDGEEIKSISERDPSQAVVEGLDALLGFNTLSRLTDDLDRVQRDIQAEVKDSPTKASFLRAKADRDDLEDKKQQLEEDLVEVKRKIADAQGEAARIDERLNNIFHGSSVQESSEIIDKISELEGESRSLTNEIGRFVGDLLYIALPADLLTAAGARVTVELAGRNWLTNKTQFDPHRDKVLDRFLGPSAPQPEPPLTSGQTAFLRRRLVEEWTQMFYPPPDGVPEDPLFDDWPTGAMEDALRQLDEVRDRTRQELVTRIGRRNRIDRELQRLRLAHKQFQVGPEAQQAIDRKSELAAKLAELEIESQNSERAITAITAEIGNTTALVNKLGETVNQTEAVRRRYDVARDLRLAIREFMDELRQRRITELSRRMTEMMRRLAHKGDLVSKISIDPATYVLRILNARGEEVQSPSAGEREVFALSMLWGLAQISKRNLPVVIVAQGRPGAGRGGGRHGQATQDALGEGTGHPGPAVHHAGAGQAEVLDHLGVGVAPGRLPLPDQAPHGSGGNEIGAGGCSRTFNAMHGHQFSPPGR
jgi:DNA sulfur modification protein DndD